jgi:hypothetical protein
MTDRTPIPSAELDALDALAGKATPLHWEAQNHSAPEDGVGVIAWPGEIGRGASNGLIAWATLAPTEMDAEDYSKAEANAAFIAAANPATVQRLAAEIRALRAGLKPFAREAACYDDTSVPDDYTPQIQGFEDDYEASYTVGDLRRARALLPGDGT